jgi:hypothetical protein
MNMRNAQEAGAVHAESSYELWELEHVEAENGGRPVEMGDRSGALSIALGIALWMRTRSTNQRPP